MSSNFSVLQVCFSEGWGGLEQYPLNLAEPFARHGIKVYYWAFVNTNFARKAQEQGYDIKLFKSRFSILFHIRRLVAWIKENEIRAVHFHKSTDVRIAYLLRFFLPDVCLVFTEHMNAKRPKKSIFHRLIYSKLDYVIAISEHTRANNLKALPIAEEKLLRVYSGIDLKKFKKDLSSHERVALRKALKVSSEDIAIALPGRISSGKGQEVFIKAIELIENDITMSVKIHAFLIGGLLASEGADEKLVEVIQKLVKNLELEDTITFTGYRSDMHEILQAMDIVCIPSSEEAFGLVAIEAMALGLPVVGANTGALPEILGWEERYGLLADIETPKELSQQIARLAVSEELRSSLGRAALLRVHQEFCIDRHVEKLKEIYRFSD